MNPALSLYDNLKGCLKATPPGDKDKLYALLGELSEASMYAKKREDRDLLTRAMSAVEVMINEEDPVWQKIIRVYPPTKTR